ncbi:hypothetical protein BDZ91DRAFT_717280, partial [Kalaharituber pfeilii]
MIFAGQWVSLCNRIVIADKDTMTTETEMTEKQNGKKTAHWSGISSHWCDNNENDAVTEQDFWTLVHRILMKKSAIERWYTTYA